MLLQFRFKNYKSFADDTIFNMMASGIKEHSDSLIEKNGHKVLPVAAVFGANASGKSNFFSAFESMAEIVWDSVGSQAIAYIFNEGLQNEPTEYEVCLNIDDKEHRYGFSVKDKRICEEWLFSKNFSFRTRSAEKLIFYRSDGKVETGKLNTKEEKEISYVASMVTDTKLMITDIGKRGKSIYQSIYQWFYYGSLALDFSNELVEAALSHHIIDNLVENMHESKPVIAILKTMDPSILDIKAKKELDNNLKEGFRVYSTHLLENGEVVDIPFESESNGTKKFFVLVWQCFDACTSGRTLVIDELDAKLHPLILRYIVQMFTNKESNTGHGQLIFSAHNLICLDASDLRRDEIWFVEKNRQRSSLYSLYDFKSNEETVRSDLSFGKHYLAGRFGAIPFQEEVADGN